MSLRNFSVISLADLTWAAPASDALKVPDICGYTTLLANSDLPEDWEGGRFHLVEFGLYVVLDGITASTFTGLRLHGGTPPLAPAGAIIPSWAYRWVVVLYPQGATLDGRVNMNICTQTDGTLVQLTPEIKGLSIFKPAVEEDCEGDEDPEETIDGNEINFVEDGHLLMTPQAEIDFLARAFYQILLSQQEKGLNIWLASGLLLQRVLHGSSLQQTRVKSMPEPLYPTSLSRHQQAYLNWLEHRNYRLQIIPSASQSYKPPSKDEIAHAAQQALNVLKFNEENIVANMAKKQKCRAGGGGKHKRPHRLIEDETSEDDNEELSNDEDEPSYQVARFIEHRLSADPKRTYGYEYLVEWVEDGSQSWAHESLIDAGPMYEEYQQSLRIPFMMAVSNDSLIRTTNLLEDSISHREAAEGVSIKDLYQQANRFHAAIETSPLELKTMTIAVHTWELNPSVRHWIMEKQAIHINLIPRYIFLISHLHVCTAGLISLNH
ncbi:hypothetical protein BDP27DRAFT_1364875 [Rhodocollybia butyracea]|uniref:Chromo domain-containing protein n=1 Tax=Rhodocollybia butyracea TaxID=206335 RepID=A0A9P5PSZ8_9AGAR|nr:hypothetical protein BDP27DRAFT_1364875 [Rhodocollybia butyracea]